MERIAKILHNTKVKTIMLFISYAAFLFLLTPSKKIGFVISAVLFVLGFVIVIIKKPFPKVSNKSRGTHCGILTFFIDTCFGFLFYNRWLPSSAVKAVSSIIGVSSPSFILVLSICLTVFSALFIYYALISLCESSLFKGKISSFLTNDILWCAAVSFATFFMTQVMIGEPLPSFVLPIYLFLCVIIIFAVILLIYSLIGNMKISIGIGTGVFFVVSVINVYVYRFRQRLFEPVDIFTVGTVKNVADNYNFLPIPKEIIIGFVLWAIILIITLRCNLKHKASLKKRIFILLCCVLTEFGILSYSANVRTHHWQKEGAHFNGYVLNFVAEIKEMNVSKPKGYSTENISKESLKYLSAPNNSESQEKPPHIFVVMNEAFSDLSVIGNINTDKEVTPFISSLKENTIKGYALTSIYGGNTCNSEYEFLTGNSMAWLSPNAIPYQQYLNTPSYSMARYLKNQYDYKCIAMHPYLSSGWNRPTAYSNLGFDKSLFIEDFPQKDYVREYISDSEMYGEVINLYEAHINNPLFLMCVSMQNHGDYRYTGKNFEKTISLVGYDNDYPDVEQYLSLIHETDKATKKLITYFEDAKDKVVVVFFGDHQPILNGEFLEEITKSDSNSLEGQQDKYTVPFFIWANYDIEEKYIEQISLNFLSSHVFETAGLSKPTYNNFLTEMQNTIPAINANGFYSSKRQCYVKFEDASKEEQKWLRLYEQLQYNNIFDNKNKVEKFFAISK